MHSFNALALFALIACANAFDVFRAGGASTAVNAIRSQDFNIVDGKVAADAKKGLSTAPTRDKLLGGGNKNAYQATSEALTAAGFTVVKDSSTHITVGVHAGSSVIGHTSDQLKNLLNSKFTKLANIQAEPKPKPKPAPKVPAKKPAAAAQPPKSAKPAARPASPSKKLHKKRISYDFETRDAEERDVAEHEFEARDAEEHEFEARDFEEREVEEDLD